MFFILFSILINFKKTSVWVFFFIHKFKEVFDIKITAKQQKFADEYIDLGNAKQAVINAGYSKKTAKAIGAENL